MTYVQSRDTNVTKASRWAEGRQELEAEGSSCLGEAEVAPNGSDRPGKLCLL